MARLRGAVPVHRHDPAARVAPQQVVDVRARHRQRWGDNSDASVLDCGGRRSHWSSAATGLRFVEQDRRRPTPTSRKVPFTLTKAGCDPAHLELPAGAATFEVKNDGADAVTEMEIHTGRAHPRRGREPHARPLRLVQHHAAARHLRDGLPERQLRGQGRPRRDRRRRVDHHRARRAAPPRPRSPTYRKYVEDEAARWYRRRPSFVNAVKARRRRRRPRSCTPTRARTTRASSPSRRASATSTPRSTPARTTCPPPSSRASTASRSSCGSRATPTAWPRSPTSCSPT